MALNHGSIGIFSAQALNFRREWCDKTDYATVNHRNVWMGLLQHMIIWPNKAIYRQNTVREKKPIRSSSSLNYAVNVG